MNILAILGHPNPESFNHAIAETACQTLTRLGHHVTLHDLYAERFNPLLSPDELTEGAPPEEIARHCDELAATEGILVVHPNWRDQPPAIVKGWVDRVFRVGVAFEYAGEEGEQGIPVGLLRAESALIVTTSDCPPMPPDPLDKLWKESIFGACGVKKVARKNLSSVLLSDEATRKTWLGEVEQMVQDVFPHTPVQ